MPATNSARQERAIQNLVDGMSQRDAYEKAGYAYTPASASRFYTRPTIAARLRELLKAKQAAQAKVAARAAETAGVDRAWVVDRLKYVAEVAIRGAPVRDKTTGQQVIDGNGKPVFDGKMQLAAATRALQLLGIDIGMFVQRHEVGDPGEFARLSNDELEERVAKDMRALGVDPSVLEVLMAQAGFSEDSLTIGEA